MFVHVALALLLLIAILPLSCLTILGVTKSSLRSTCVTLVGPLVLMGLATLPWWLAFLGVHIAGAGIIFWGGVVGAVIGVLVPAWPKLMIDSHQLLRQGYTPGLFGTRDNAKGTLEWAYVLIILILCVRPRNRSTLRLPLGILTIVLGALIGLGLCLLVS